MLKNFGMLPHRSVKFDTNGHAVLKDELKSEEY